MMRGVYRVALLWMGLLLLSAPAILHGCNQGEPDPDTDVDTEPADTEPTDTEPTDTDPADTCLETTTADDVAFDGGHPDVDITEVRGHLSESNVAVVDVDVAGAFPPDSALYSWFLAISFSDIDGQEQVHCFHQVHDGVASESCSPGDPANLTTCARPEGLTVVYDGSVGAPLAGFAVSSGVQASSSDPGPAMHDPVSGQFPEACADPPPACD